MIPDKIKIFFGENEPWGLNLKSYSIKYNMYEACSSFTAEIMPSDYYIQEYDNNNLKDNLLMLCGQRFEITLNDQSIMVGYIDSLNGLNSKNVFTLTINGRSMLQVLVDNYIHNGKTYNNKSVINLINAIWADNNTITKIESKGPSNTSSRTLTSILSLPNWDIQITSNARQLVNSIGNLDTYQTTPGQTLFDAINALLNNCGCYMYNPPGETYTQIDVINYYETSSRTYEINLGSSDSNVIEVNYNMSTERLYNFIRLFGEGNSFGVFTSTGDYETLKNEFKAEIENNFDVPTKFFVGSQNLLDQKQWNNPTNIINNYAINMRRGFLRTTYKLPNHTYFNEFFKPGNMCIINNDTMMMKRFNTTDFLVTGVTFEASKTQAPCTILEVMPSSFNAVDQSELH